MVKFDEEFVHCSVYDTLWDNVRGGRVIQRPDTNKLIELRRTKDAAVTRQVFKAVSDNGNEQIQHLTTEQQFTL